VDDDVDAFRHESRRRQSFEESGVEVRPEGHDGSLLVVADARIDDDATPAQLEHQRLDAQDHPAVVGGEVRQQPSVPLNVGRARLGEEELRRHRRFHLHH
jgi:hypothetical protein